ncbi:phage regulatory CII family protein [Rhizobium leguminosarum]|uniref:phage regulatory CII family protein n=1 Tax=Rhizobium leguminosarum TaxID=384 RepID=UPI0004892651|nr:phage regulatory CII family protein [Rhizobium leguminosarum]
MRTISEVEARSIKAATDAAYMLGGGVTAFPDLTRVNVSTLSKYASFNDEYRESLIPCDIAIEADRRAQSPVIVTAMARLLGYRLVRDGDDAMPSRPASLTDVMRTYSETADVIREANKALADGEIDAADSKAVLPEIDEAIRALQQLRDGFARNAR